MTNGNKTRKDEATSLWPNRPFFLLSFHLSVISLSNLKNKINGSKCLIATTNKHCLFITNDFGSSIVVLCNYYY